jgi:rubrerythrin
MIMRPLHELLIEAASHPRSPTASRRGVFVLAAAAAPMPIVLQDAVARQNNKNRNTRGTRRRRRQNQGGAGDTAILNYALSLEHLEFAFYRDGLAQFSASDFDGFLDPDLFDRLKDIRDHEGAHVDALTDIILGRGGDPVEEACYDFGPDFDEPAGFLGIAQLLENTGVMAYDGAIADIKSPRLQTAGATIATVEARHASYLNLINGDNPFPDAFDEPKSMEEILAAAGGFIVDCP